MTNLIATARRAGLLSPGLWQRLFDTYRKSEADALLAARIATSALAAIGDVRSAAAGKVLTADLLEAASAPVSLTDAATIAIDWDAFLFADVTVTANRAFGNPTNVQPGTSRTIVVKGSTSTMRTLSYPSNFKGALPVQTVNDTSWLLLVLTAYTTSHIVISYARAL